MIQNISSKMYFTLCTNTNRDATDFNVDGMFGNVKTWISQKQNLTLTLNKSILKLSFKDFSFSSYNILGEVNFNAKPVFKQEDMRKVLNIDTHFTCTVFIFLWPTNHNFWWSIRITTVILLCHMPLRLGCCRDYFQENPNSLMWITVFTITLNFDWPTTLFPRNKLLFK